MLSIDRTPYYPRIQYALLVCAGGAILLSILVLFLPAQRKIDEIAFEAQSEVTQHAARSLQLAASNVLKREWDSLVGFSAYVDVDDHTTSRNLSDVAAMVSQGIYWAAVTDLSGTVVAATSGVDEGTDMSDKAWFRNGLRGDQVETVPAATGEPGNGVINMSRPIRDPISGRVKGVAVYRLQTAWLETYMADAADRLGVDLAILDHRGETIYAHGDLVGAVLEPTLRSSAVLGTTFQPQVSGGAGERYVSGILPDMIEGDMPAFGWSLVVRVPLAAGPTALGDVMASMFWPIAALFTAIAAVALIFALRYLKPLADLARDAAAIADGHVIYPPEAYSTHEAHLLSTALARLQSRLHTLTTATDDKKRYKRVA
jgi:hypothetical protein